VIKEYIENIKKTIAKHDLRFFAAVVLLTLYKFFTENDGRA
jgi:hypothetical protein